MRMLSVPELAERLGVHANTVRAMLKRDELPSIKIGGRYFRVREADADAYMAGELTRS